MNSRIKVDEDLPRQVAEVLTARGYDVKTVVGQGWQGFADAAIFFKIQSENRWLLTADKGFADLRAYPPGQHAGIILLRPAEESRRSYVELLELALDQLDLDQNSGALIVVTAHGLRIRRPSKL